MSCNPMFGFSLQTGVKVIAVVEMLNCLYATASGITALLNTNFCESNKDVPLVEPLTRYDSTLDYDSTWNETELQPNDDQPLVWNETLPQVVQVLQQQYEDLSCQIFATIGVPQVFKLSLEILGFAFVSLLFVGVHKRSSILCELWMGWSCFLLTLDIGNGIRRVFLVGTSMGALLFGVITTMTRMYCTFVVFAFEMEIRGKTLVLCKVY